MQMMNMVTSSKGNQADMFSTQSTHKEGSGKPFQSILDASGSGQTRNGLAALLDGMSDKEVLQHVMAQLEEGTSLEDLLVDLGIEDLADLFTAFPGLIESNPEVLDMFDEVNQLDGAEKATALDSLKSKLQDVLLGASDEQSGLENNTVSFITFIDSMHADDLKQEMQDVLRQVAALLATFKSDAQLDKADANKLTALIKQWSVLMRQANDADMDPEELQAQMLDEDESDLLNKLMERMDKRSYYASKNMYAQDAKVSRQDVMKWLQQAINNQETHSSKTVDFGLQDQQMPMSRVEQHVIHLDQTGRVEKVGTDMVNKFADIMRGSQFLNKHQGKMELNLMLRPAHLGNITVKMAQVDGDMTVKLLVSSQAAKDMLESNMHQLRHLFQPHQVSVERNEAVSDEEFYYDDQEEQNSQEEHQAANEQHQNQENHEDSQELDFEAIFNQLNKEVTN